MLHFSCRIKECVQMIGQNERFRQQLNEHLEQPNARDRVLTHGNKTPEELAALERILAYKDKVNQDRILYRSQEQEKAEKRLQERQDGIPEMENVADTIEQKQLRNGFGFIKPMLDAVFRMVRKASELVIAKIKHDFKIDKKEENLAINEAGNNPTPKKTDSLEQALKKDEKEIKQISSKENKISRILAFKRHYRAKKKALGINLSKKTQDKVVNRMVKRKAPKLRFALKEIEYR